MSRNSPVEAFVLSYNSESRAFFAFSPSFERDLYIEQNLVPENLDILGRWIRVVVRDKNNVCQPVVVIDDVFESRIFHNLPEILIDVKYDGEYDGKGMYYHPYFNLVFDPHGVIRYTNRDECYRVWIVRHKEPGAASRWKVSGSNQNIRRGIEGIVHSYAKNGNGYYVWSKSDPKSRIVVNYNQSPSQQTDLLGSWVKMYIDENYYVTNRVIEIDEVFKTRVKSRVVEINAEFECVRDSSERFYHSYFGYIADPRNIMRRGSDVGRRYRGWIAYHHVDGTDARWRLATDQDVVGPLGDQHQSYDSRPSDYQNRRSSPEPYGYRRDSSPEVVNIYSDETPEDRYRPNSSSNNYREYGSKRNPQDDYDHRRQYDYNRPSEYGETSRPRRDSRGYDYHDDSRNSDRFREHRSGEYQRDYETSSNDGDRRNQRPLTPETRDNWNSRGYDQSENYNTRSYASSSAPLQKALSSSEESDSSGGWEKEDPSKPSSSGLPMASSDRIRDHFTNKDDSKTKESHSETNSNANENEKKANETSDSQLDKGKEIDYKLEIRRCKAKLELITRLHTFFTSNEEVAQAMQNEDPNRFNFLAQKIREANEQ